MTLSLAFKVPAILYIQIKNAVKSNIFFNVLQQPLLLEQFNWLKKQLSQIYKLLSAIDPKIAIPKNKWKDQDLSMSTDPNAWLQICSNTMTLFTNIQLIQYRVLHNFTQCKMYKMGLNTWFHCLNCPLLPMPSGSVPGVSNYGKALCIIYPWLCPATLHCMQVTA